MFNTEKELILRMVELMPRVGLSYDRFAFDNPLNICAKTL